MENSVAPHRLGGDLDHGAVTGLNGDLRGGVVDDVLHVLKGGNVEGLVLELFAALDRAALDREGAIGTAAEAENEMES